jgi:hypothetical protein
MRIQDVDVSGLRTPAACGQVGLRMNEHRHAVTVFGRRSMSASENDSLLAIGDPQLNVSHET